MSEIGAATAETTTPDQLDDTVDERIGVGEAGAEVSTDPAASPGKGTGLYPPRRSGRSTRMIGEVVVDLGFADRETVDEAVETARSQGRPTGLVLVEQGVLRHDQLARVVAERFGLDYVDLTIFDLDMGAVNLLSSDAAKRYQAVPVGFTEDGTLLLAMADPTNVLTIDDVAMMTGRRVRPVAASVEDLNLMLTRLSGMEESIADIVDEVADGDDEADLQLDDADSDAPVIKLVHSIVAQAVQQGASDIHVNPEEGDTRVLFRVDGVLAPAATVRRKMAMGVVSRIKIMGDLDISEKRMPQDGRFALTVDGRRVDIRVVTLPLVYGEGVVLRILDKGTVVQGLDGLGMPAHALEQFSSAIHKPNGAVLVTGPTGSGKSTTLYAALHALNDGERSILTIEDPVEQRIAGIKQMQIAPKAGVTFDVGLRSMLRADPDVIMVGEIRDSETAHIAVEAALTGHLVLTTLHTRDAPSGLGRLIDMGIEPFLVSSAVDCIVAQRLVRQLCKHCKRPQKLSDAVLAEHGLSGAQPFEPVGCSRCGGTGYRGRLGVYEVMSVSEHIRALILERASVDVMVAVAVREGMRRLRDDGIDKVRDGLTSIAEVERMTNSLL
ncbi:MAG TPA: ATPase, T2SS/T4P/T4SS family [Solirubrobacteraceae bacterium]|jgi:type IV pilus assembly protein PilB|nr:ATPase, T2SS/T4P/T4SS family [Solirubrobacteraceae bacterium]